MKKVVNLCLQDPNVKLKDILICSDFSSTLRSESKQLFQYLFPINRERKELKELIDWALTKKNNVNYDEDFIYNRNAAAALSTPSVRLQKALLEDGTLEQALDSFLTTERLNPLSQSPEFAGNFSRICAQFSRQNRFAFLKNHPKFYKRLLKYAKLMAYQRLFIDMFSEDLDAFSGSKPAEVVEELSKNLMSTDEELVDAIFVILRGILTESSDEEIHYFTKNQFLEQIIKSTQRQNNLSLLINMVSTILMLFQYVEPQAQEKALNDFKDMQYEKYCQTDIRKAYVLFPLFWRQGIKVMTQYFFSPTDPYTGSIPNSLFIQDYVNVFKRMSLKDRIRYIEELDLINLISNAISLSPNYSDIKFNMAVFQLVKVLAKPPKDADLSELFSPTISAVLNSEKWSNIVFYVTKFFDDFKVAKFNELGYEKLKTNSYGF